MQIRTLGGGSLDVSPRYFQSNMNAGTQTGNTGSLQLDSLAGNYTAPSRAPALLAVQANQSHQWGDFIEVPAHSVRYIRPTFSFNGWLIWTLPSGRQIRIDDVSANASIVSNWWDVIGQEITVSRASIKLLPFTLPGFEEFGLVTRSQINGEAADEPNSGGPLDISLPTFGTAASVSGAIVVVALVAAAIWLLPKGSLKGVVK